ncbi:MAG TPA: hypothetical protein VMV19_03080 [Xanthobacteraceae bacterium]|nr:hypothetical protein [Xanthobacteraceae bacterium]
MALDTSKLNIQNDLTILFTEMNSIVTKRNHCLHWIWEKVEHETELTGLASIDLFAPRSKPTFQVKRPAYRQSGILSESFSAEQIKILCDDASWLSRRLASHTLDETALREQREELNQTGAIIASSENVRTFADLFWPAPWLDKPLRPESTPSSRPGGQK